MENLVDSTFSIKARAIENINIEIMMDENITNKERKHKIDFSLSLGTDTYRYTPSQIA